MLLLVFEWTKKSVCIAIFQMETYDAEEHTNFQHKDKKNECAREKDAEDGGGLCGATPSFPFFAFYDDIFSVFLLVPLA